MRSGKKSRLFEVNFGEKSQNDHLSRAMVMLVLSSISIDQAPESVTLEFSTSELWSDSSGIRRW